MRVVGRRADLLERSLQGLPGRDQQVQTLVRTARSIPALTSAACAPRVDFVSSLGLQLRAEALRLPTREVRRPSLPVAPGTATRPVVLVIGRGLRVLAGTTASLMLIGVILGVTSRSALPGGLLYPVKEVLDSAAVQLTGSDFDRGVTLLSQAQGHIGDARSLVERDRALADPASVDQALLSAGDDTSAGQQALLGDYGRTRNPRALMAVQDFTVRALPQLIALRPMVPTASKPDVDALIALLHQTRSTLARTVAACGAPCGSFIGTTTGSSPPSAGARPLLPVRSLPNPDFTSGGLSGAGLKATINGTGGSVVGPVAPHIPVGTGGKVGVSVPPVTVGHTTITPSPIVIPPVTPLPSLTLVPTVPALPTGLPSLP